MDSASLGLFNDINLASASEPVLPNGTLCTCESCIERRYVLVFLNYYFALFSPHHLSGMHSSVCF